MIQISFWRSILRWEFANFIVPRQIYKRNDTWASFQNELFLKPFFTFVRFLSACMGQPFSSLSLGTSPSNELGLVCFKMFQTKYSGLVVLKLQPGGDLLLAGNEVGCLLLFDISLDCDSPGQVLALAFEYGGISEICWLDLNTVAVGTTRGRIIIFSIKNELRRLAEISSVKAHGDGAAQIAVEGLDYCQKSHCLVSVAEGVGSVRLWALSDDGVLTARKIPKLTTAYCTPRYVGFSQGGSQVIVVFMEQSLIQVFSTDPLEIKEEFRLGKDYEYINQDHLGNALVLDTMDRLVLYNLHDGCTFYTLPSMSCCTDAKYPRGRNDGNPYCNQGIASLRNATYVASVSNHGVIHILRTRNGSPAGGLKIPGRGRQDIQAIHATSGNRAALVAASTVNVDGPCKLTVWKTKDEKNIPSIGRNEHSTVGIIFLCIGICLSFQLFVSLLLLYDIGGVFNRRPSTLVGQLRHDGPPHPTSQPLDALASVVTILPATSVSGFAQPSQSFQPSIPRSSPHQPGNAGDNVDLLSSGLGSNEEACDSANHNSESPFTCRK